MSHTDARYRSEEIAPDMDKRPQDKCCGDSCNLLYMFPGPFVLGLIQIGPVTAEILLIWTNVPRTKMLPGQMLWWQL